MMDNEQNIQNGLFSRRQVFITLGSGALMVAGTGSVALTIEYLTPNVLMEPAAKFLAGKPGDYPPDSVVFLFEPRVIIIRDAEGYFYALSAVCTHLGCIVNWKAQEGIFACPCHGSKYNKAGEVIAGPAPKSLTRIAMSLTADGFLQVDKNKSVDETFILKV